MQESLKEFYWEYKNEVKTYKGYVLTGIDGSDFEVPNTKSSREKYNGKQQTRAVIFFSSILNSLLFLYKYIVATIYLIYHFSINYKS